MEAGGVPVTGDERFRDPRWRWPEYESGAVIELRVHGVGGEGPEGMTRDDHPVLVGGDRDVGFWRARRPLSVVDDGPSSSPTGSDGPPPDDPGPRAGPQRVREVVSWGGSTSGHRRSAWWVVLLPFALFNAAGRMAPGDTSERRYEAHQVVCRLLGLSLTLSVVAITSGIAFDLLALQCAAQAPCATAPATGGWLLAPLRWSGDDAAALLAVLALLPLGVPYLLRTAARRQLARKPPLADPGPEHHRLRGARRLDERDTWHNMWPAWRLRGLHVTAGYSWVLLVLGLLLPVALPDADMLPAVAPVAVVTLLAGAVLVALPRVAGSAHSRSYGAAILAVRWLTLVPLGLVLGVGLAERVDLRSSPVLAPVLGVAAVAAFVWATREHLRHVRQDVGGGSGPPGSVRDVVLVVATAVGGMLAGLDGPTHRTAEEVAAAIPDAGALLDPLLAGLAGGVYAPVLGLVAVQSLLLIALVVTSGGSGTERAARGSLPAVTTVPGNLTAPVVTLVTLLLATGIGAGVHALALDWLGTRVTTTDEVVVSAVELVTPSDDGTMELDDAAAVLEEVAAADPRASIELVLPWWYVLTAVVVVATLIVLGAVAIGLDRWLRWRAMPPDDVVRDALRRGIAGLPAADDLDPARSETVAAVVDRARSQWLHQGLVRRGGAALFVVELVVLAGLLVLVAVKGVGGLAAADVPFDSFALAVVAAIPPASVALLRAAREDRVVRRQIGALWDVLCFWPRATHPFAPPSYGEAVVPAVVERINRYPDDSTVVLAGHSQGSVIALAAVLSPALEARRLHLVTYGSPVSLLYEGFFPSVFGGDEGAIAQATPGDATGGPSPLATWHNVLSITEPISTPLWGWSAEGPPSDDDTFGWPLRLRLPWRTCPACGWVRADLPDAEPPAHHRPAIDMTVTDPDRVLSPSVEVDGRAEGHSSYHRSRELDVHLAHLV